jgi:hypothetical protein
MRQRRTSDRAIAAAQGPVVRAVYLGLLHLGGGLALWTALDFVLYGTPISLTEIEVLFVWAAGFAAGSWFREQDQ